MVICFSIIYLFYPNAADEKVRKFRAVATIEMMRTSWEKTINNPYLRALSFADRGFLGIRKEIMIPRPTPPSPSSFALRGEPLSTETKALLLFAGSKEELRHATCLILDVPGGGFVSMPPRCHEDYLSIWARQTRVPIISLDYGKAPEKPYPYAIEECFDAYRSITESNGGCIGMEGWYLTDSNGRPQTRKDPIKILIVGDSAGGNIATGVVLKCLDSKDIRVQPPSGLILIYPCLNFDMGCWMPPAQRSLFRAESKKDMSMTGLVELHTSMHAKSPLAVPPAPRGINVLKNEVDRRGSWYRIFSSKNADPGPAIPSSLSMTSRMSYFTDRVLAPEMLRGMALMYLGQSPKPINFETDYYLSPVNAPDEILARFPRTFLICGEKDPLVDDMIVFAGRLRQAKAKARFQWDRLRDRQERDLERQNSEEGVVFGKPLSLNTTRVNFANENGPESPTSGSPSSDSEHQRERSSGLPAFSESDVNHHVFHRDPDSMVRVKILEGMSHAILQMVALLPESKQTVALLSDWSLEMLEDEETAQQVGVAPGDEAQELTDYMVKGLNARKKANMMRYDVDMEEEDEEGDVSVPMLMRSSPPRKAGKLAEGANGGSGGVTMAAAKMMMENGAAAGKANGSIRSRSGSPMMPGSRSRGGSKAAAFTEKVTEQNFLDRRNKALADSHDLL
ncbi:hypothetical protein HK101_006227 [Irineochytrium annulatum]|nr:hypothetical protein HK101_006227 [Irineochytrium annulatum]